MLKLVDGSELTEEIKNNFKRGTTKAYLKLTDGTIIDNNNYLQSVKLEELRYHEEEQEFIGEAVAKRATVTIYNENNEIDLEDKEFELFIGTQGENIDLYNYDDLYDISTPSLITKNNDNWMTATKTTQPRRLFNNRIFIKS